MNQIRNKRAIQPAPVTPAYDAPRLVYSIEQARAATNRRLIDVMEQARFGLTLNHCQELHQLMIIIAGRSGRELDYKLADFFDHIGTSMVDAEQAERDHDEAIYEAETRVADEWSSRVDEQEAEIKHYQTMIKAVAKITDDFDSESFVVDADAGKFVDKIREAIEY